MIHSKYQIDIHNFANDGVGSAAINSVAGSGKTTTGIEICKIFDNQLASGRFLAFNRHIKEELASRATGAGITGFEFLTYNGFGSRILNRAMKEAPRLNENKDRNILLYKVAARDQRAAGWASTIVRLISLFKNMALMSIDSAASQLEEIVLRHDIDVPKESLFLDYLFQTFGLSINMHNVISFDDQKYLPVYLGMDIPQCDVVVIDEFQDTCEIESQLVLKGCVGGRVFVFGDPDQCIYSFKGTTPDALSKFVGLQHAVELPLSVCYRCPIEVVKEAQKYVPRIEWNSEAIEGVVDDIKKKDFLVAACCGDMVLSRCTVDAVESCLNMIRMGKRAYVQGREIGVALIELVDRIGDDDVGGFIKELEIYLQEEVTRLTAAGAETRLANLEDKVETVRVIAESCDSVSGIKERITSIFETSSDAVAHMTIHKAKGLESDGNVYLLAPEKIPHKRARQEWQVAEEYRLMYVAITRARRGFYYVR